MTWCRNQGPPGGWGCVTGGLERPQAGCPDVQCYSAPAVCCWCRTTAQGACAAGAMPEETSRGDGRTDGSLLLEEGLNTRSCLSQMRENNPLGQASMKMAVSAAGAQTAQVMAVFLRLQPVSQMALPRGPAGPSLAHSSAGQQDGMTSCWEEFCTSACGEPLSQASLFQPQPQH